MDPEVLQQVLDELLPTLEAMEAQNAAILQFLKDRYILSDEDLAPFREKAGNASSVRWLGTRLRVKHILEGAARAAELSEEKKSPPAEQKSAESKPAEAKPAEATPANARKDQPAKDQPPKTELDKVEVKPENQERAAEKKPADAADGKPADKKEADSKAKADADPTPAAKKSTPPEPSDKAEKSTAA